MIFCLSVVDDGDVEAWPNNLFSSFEARDLITRVGVSGVTILEDCTGQQSRFSRYLRSRRIINRRHCQLVPFDLFVSCFL